MFTEKSSRKSEGEFFKGITGPALSDSDSNDADELKKNGTSKRIDPTMPVIQEVQNNNSEPFDLIPNVRRVESDIETLSQLPIVNLGEDFDWEEIVNKSKETPKNSSVSEVTNSKTSPEKLNNCENQKIINNKPFSSEDWSRGQVPGLQVICDAL